jgi:hypothetical protein
MTKSNRGEMANTTHIQWPLNPWPVMTPIAKITYRIKQVGRGAAENKTPTPHFLLWLLIF